MNVFKESVVFQEVPDEVSISILVAGCNHGCKGCHSAFSWDEKSGFYLDEQYFLNLLTKYNELATCVLFLGGEWELKELEKFLSIVKTKTKYKTCLYTGAELDFFIGKKEEVLKNLDYIKTGKWDSSLGGLNSELSNQKFYTLKNGIVEKDITSKFLR